MRNRYLESFDRIIKVRIVGSNINSYVKRIVKRKIHIIRLIPISKREVHVILRFGEYKKLLELKSIYEITVLENLGSKKFIEQFKKNYILLLFMVIGLFFIILLSRVVFSVEVIHQDSEIRNLVADELKKYGLVKYSFKKNYQDLEKIKLRILEDNKEKLEWMEISFYGTKCIVRIEERKFSNNKEDFKYQSIVSKKDAVIVRIEAVRGEKVKFANDYVNKGDVIISGYVTRSDNTKVVTKAEGVVYGEVWYEVNVDYPIVYQESNLTGNVKTVYAFYFFGKRLGLFDFDDFRSFESKSKVLFSFNMLDIKFVEEEEYEVIVKDEVYTEDIAKVKAIDYIKNKLMRDNGDIVEIRDVKIINTSSDEDSIEFKLFVRAIEDIGKVELIDEGSEEGIV